MLFVNARSCVCRSYVLVYVGKSSRKSYVLSAHARFVHGWLCILTHSHTHTQQRMVITIVGAGSQQGVELSALVSLFSPLLTSEHGFQRSS